MKSIISAAFVLVLFQATSIAAEIKNTAKPGTPASDILWVVSDFDTPADAAKRPNKTISYNIDAGSSFDEANSKCKQNSDRPASCRLLQKFKGDKKIAIARLRVNGGISASDEGARFFVKALSVDGKGLKDVEALAIDECKKYLSKNSPSEIYNATEPCFVVLSFNNDAFVRQEVIVAKERGKIAAEREAIARENARIARENLNNFKKSIPAANNQRSCGADGRSNNGEYSYSYNPDCGFRIQRCSPMGQSPEGCQYYKY